METVSVLNTFGVILAVVGLVVVLIGFCVPGFNATYRQRFAHAVNIGVILLALGLGLLLVIYLTGLLI